MHGHACDDLYVRSKLVLIIGKKNCITDPGLSALPCRHPSDYHCIHQRLVCHHLQTLQVGAIWGQYSFAGKSSCNVGLHILSRQTPRAVWHTLCGSSKAKADPSALVSSHHRHGLLLLPCCVHGGPRTVVCRYELFCAFCNVLLLRHSCHWIN